MIVDLLEKSKVFACYAKVLPQRISKRLLSKLVTVEWIFLALRVEGPERTLWRMVAEGLARFNWFISFPFLSFTSSLLVCFLTFGQ